MALERERSLIINVRESNSSDKFDDNFLQDLKSRQKLQEVTIEVSDLSGLTYTRMLSSALETFVAKFEEHIALSYSTNDFGRQVL